jgi:hypothetical protein
MQWLVSLEPVEENGLRGIVLIAVEIAAGVVDRVAVVDAAADGVDDPVAAADAVGTADRDTRSSSIRRPRVCSRGLFYVQVNLGILVSHPFRKERGKGWATHHLRLVDDFLSDILVSHPFRKGLGKGWATIICVWSTIFCLAFLFPTLSAENAEKDGPPIIWVDQRPILTCDCRFGALGGSGREIVPELPV